MTASRTTVRKQLITAIKANNLPNMREILSQKNEDGHNWTAKDKDIHRAFRVAASKVRIECCRLLFFRLSQRGKQKYFADVWEGSRSTTRGLAFPPLTEAVMNENLQPVRLFVEEFKFNINQEDSSGKTPLFYAGKNWQILRFLLENGAKVNVLGGDLCNGPLGHFACEDNTNAARLLLEYGADPNLNRRPVGEEDVTERLPRTSDYAIMRGNTETLRMLLQRGAFLGGTCFTTSETSLINLLRSDRPSENPDYRLFERRGLSIHRERLPEVKLSICRILVQHAETDEATADFLQKSLEIAITNSPESGPGSYESAYKILLEAGMDRNTALHLAIQAENLSVCRTLVTEYRVDPFLERDEEGDDGECAASSHFHAAARMGNTDVLEYFLELWDNQFSSNGGKNRDGDYPIHVLCCDPLVSLQAIQLLVERQPDTLSMVDGEQGLLPLHFASMWNASLDVIFCLLQHGPDELDQRRDAYRHSSNTGEAAAMKNHRSRPPSGKNLIEWGPATKRAKTL